MKRPLLLSIGGALCLGLGFVIANPNAQILSKLPPKEIHFALLQTSQNNDAYQSFMAFKSVLKEEGIPTRQYSEAELIKLVPDEAYKTLKSIHLPDASAKQISSGMVAWLREYTKAGGHLVVIYDAATQSPKGHFYEYSPLRDLTGVDHGQYHKYRKNMFLNSAIQFTDPQASHYWAITPGKLDHKLQIQGYSYGALQYPIIQAKVLSPTVKLYATDSKKKTPILSEHTVQKGMVYWVNTPLGRLKGSGDDLLLRLMLRRVAQNSNMPKLIPTPEGKGALVINWHVDANSDWQSLPLLLSKKFLNPNLQYSFHITAGPDRDQPGDQLGFDACGKGKNLANRLRAFGVLGNHGGWAHNYFADILQESNHLTPEVVKLVDQNTTCIQSLTNQNIKEYSAPTGVHPQPDFTHFLEKRGFIGYYYTGDSGSAPNFTFYKGKKVSKKVVAVPITPYEKYASVEELSKANVPPQKVTKWLTNLSDYIKREQTIRLIYSHPYDLTQHPTYLPAWTKLFQQLEKGIKEDQLTTLTITDVAHFIQKFNKTDAHFYQDGDKLQIELYNESGLDKLAFRLPRQCLNNSWPDYITNKGNFLVIKKNFKNVKLALDCHI